MRRPLLLAILSVFLSLGPTQVGRAGDITYNIQSYDSLQNGFTLSGTITTDGTLGVLASSDIASWTFTITKGSFSSTMNSTDPGTLVALSNLTATATQILLPPPSSATDFNLFELTNTGGEGLVYDQNPQPPGFPYYVGSTPGNLGNSFFCWFDSTPPPPSLGGTTWVIAQVPEPASLTLTLLGGACRRRVREDATSPPEQPDPGGFDSPLVTQPHAADVGPVGHPSFGRPSTRAADGSIQGVVRPSLDQGQPPEPTPLNHCKPVAQVAFPWLSR